VRDEQLEALRVQHREELAAETRRLLTEGEVAPLTPKMVDELRTALRDPRILADEIAVERAFIAAVDRDPSLVARALTLSDSSFGRDDVDRYLVDRIVDVGEIERLSDRIFAEDTSLVLRSADVADGVWTTKEMLAIEQQVAHDARALAEQPDRGFSVQRRAQAVAEMEAERFGTGQAVRALGGAKDRPLRERRSRRHPRQQRRRQNDHHGGHPTRCASRRPPHPRRHDRAGCSHPARSPGEIRIREHRVRTARR
jgi:hypothetical protein